MSHDESLADEVRAALADRDDVTERAMFGGLAFLVGGAMALALGGRGGLMVRVEPTRAAALVAAGDAEPVRMGGREMRGWVTLAAPPREEAALREWVELGVARAVEVGPRR